MQQLTRFPQPTRPQNFGSEIQYPEPFDKRLRDDCLRQLKVLLDLLQSHGAKLGETAEQGRDRRLKIMERVTSLKGRRQGAQRHSHSHLHSPG
jgi:hypothetical protein